MIHIQSLRWTFRIFSLLLVAPLVALGSETCSSSFVEKEISSDSLMLQYVRLVNDSFICQKNDDPCQDSLATSANSLLENLSEYLKRSGVRFTRTALSIQIEAKASKVSGHYLEKLAHTLNKSNVKVQFDLSKIFEDPFSRAYFHNNTLFPAFENLVYGLLDQTLYHEITHMALKLMDRNLDTPFTWGVVTYNNSSTVQPPYNFYYSLDEARAYYREVLFSILSQGRLITGAARRYPSLYINQNEVKLRWVTGYQIGATVAFARSQYSIFENLKYISAFTRHFLDTAESIEFADEFAFSFISKSKQIRVTTKSGSSIIIDLTDESVLVHNAQNNAIVGQLKARDIKLLTPVLAMNSEEEFNTWMQIHQGELAASIGSYLSQLKETILRVQRLNVDLEKCKELVSKSHTNTRCYKQLSTHFDLNNSLKDFSHTP